MTRNRIVTSLGLAMAGLLLGCSSVQERAAAGALPMEWTDLFNGTDLDGWVASGDLDAWGVRDGELVVKAPGRGGWLRTEKMYRDFDLSLEFNVPENGNSGVGLRGSATGDPAFTGMEVQIFDNHGESPADNRCGAVYNAIAPSSMAVNPAGEWNQYRIRLVGDVLDVWLNGEQIHDRARLDDRGYVHQKSNASPLRDRLTTGYIALQDHGDAVRFRNIKIRDLSVDPDPGGYAEITPNASMAGWEAFGTTDWTVEKGVLVGRDGPGHLFTTGRYTDLEIRANVWINEDGNSGLYFRVEPREDDPHTWPNGYEAQVDQHDPKNFTGCIYDRAWADALVTRDGAWFDYRVRAEGDRIRTWINGVPMVDTELDAFDKGRIAVQGHHAGNEVRYRDLRVRTLK